MADDFGHLKRDIFNSLQQNGVLNNMRVQLRQHFLQEIQRKNRRDLKSLKHDPPSNERDVILLNLVANMLRKDNLFCTLSVFLPEVGLMEVEFSDDALLWQRHFPALQFGASGGRCSLLKMIVDSCVKFASESRWASVATQTGDHAADRVGKLLDAVDSDFADRSTAQTAQHESNLEIKLRLIRSQLEEQFAEQLRHKMADFENNEVMRIKTEVQNDNRRRLDELRGQLDSDYATKLQLLHERETAFQEKEQRWRADSDRLLYEERQKVQHEADLLEQRKKAFHLSSEQREQQFLLKETALKERESGLQQSEFDLKRRRNELESIVMAKVEQFKIEEQQRLASKFRELETQEDKLREQFERIEIERRAARLLKDDFDVKCKAFDQLAAQIAQMRLTMAVEAQHKDALQKQLDRVADYNTVVQENCVLKTDNKSLKARIQECNTQLEKERVKTDRLTMELRDPSSEAKRYLDELDGVRARWTLDAERWSKSSQSLQSKLDQQTAKNGELLQQTARVESERYRLEQEVKQQAEQLAEARVAIDRLQQERLRMLNTLRRTVSARGAVGPPTSDGRALSAEPIDHYLSNFTTLERHAVALNTQVARLSRPAAHLQRSTRQHRPTSGGHDPLQFELHRRATTSEPIGSSSLTLANNHRHSTLPERHSANERLHLPNRLDFEADRLMPNRSTADVAAVRYDAITTTPLLGNQSSASTPPLLSNQSLSTTPPLLSSQQPTIASSFFGYQSSSALPSTSGTADVRAANDVAQSQVSPKAGKATGDDPSKVSLEHDDSVDKEPVSERSSPQKQRRSPPAGRDDAASASVVTATETKPTRVSFERDSYDDVISGELSQPLNADDDFW